MSSRSETPQEGTKNPNFLQRHKVEVALGSAALGVLLLGAATFGALEWGASSPNAAAAGNTPENSSTFGRTHVDSHELHIRADTNLRAEAHTMTEDLKAAGEDDLVVKLAGEADIKTPGGIDLVNEQDANGPWYEVPKSDITTEEVGVAAKQAINNAPGNDVYVSGNQANTFDVPK